MKQLIEGIDWANTAGFIVSVITIYMAIRKLIHAGHDKIMSEVLENRSENEKLTNEIKNELLAHSNSDEKKFDSIGLKFDKAFEILNRTEGKISMMASNSNIPK